MRGSAASAIPRDADGNVVLLRRGFEPGAGLWTFPGGFVDLGESVDQAALREVREELVRAFAPADVPWDELAFWSTERALRDALAPELSSPAPR